jgi:hypothetical protein
MLVDTSNVSQGIGQGNEWLNPRLKSRNILLQINKMLINAVKNGTEMKPK